MTAQGGVVRAARDQAALRSSRRVASRPSCLFPDVGGSLAVARNICASCEVAAECLEDAPRRDWHEQAACLGSDTEVWFRESDTRPAVAICRRCPVQVDCLLDALRTSSQGDTTGIRGGTTPQVRHLLRTEIRRRGGAT